MSDTKKSPVRQLLDQVAELLPALNKAVKEEEAKAAPANPLAIYGANSPVFDSLSTLTALCYNWGMTAFGPEEIMNPPRRIRRVFEEVVELAQQEGLPRSVAHGLIDHIYSRPEGELTEELGGALFTLILYAKSHNVLLADAIEGRLRHGYDALDKIREANKSKPTDGALSENAEYKLFAAFKTFSGTWYSKFEDNPLAMRLDGYTDPELRTENAQLAFALLDVMGFVYVPGYPEWVQIANEPDEEPPLSITLVGDESGSTDLTYTFTRMVQLGLLALTALLPDHKQDETIKRVFEQSRSSDGVARLVGERIIYMMLHAGYVWSSLDNDWKLATKASSDPEAEVDEDQQPRKAPAKKAVPKKAEFDEDDEDADDTPARAPKAVPEKELKVRYTAHELQSLYEKAEQATIYLTQRQATSRRHSRSVAATLVAWHHSKRQGKAPASITCEKLIRYVQSDGQVWNQMAKMWVNEVLHDLDLDAREEWGSDEADVTLPAKQRGRAKPPVFDAAVSGPLYREEMAKAAWTAICRRPALWAELDAKHPNLKHRIQTVGLTEEHTDELIAAAASRNLVYIGFNDKHWLPRGQDESEVMDYALQSKKARAVARLVVGSHALDILAAAQNPKVEAYNRLDSMYFIAETAGYRWADSLGTWVKLQEHQADIVEKVTAQNTLSEIIAEVALDDDDEAAVATTPMTEHPQQPDSVIERSIEHEENRPGTFDLKYAPDPKEEYTIGATLPFHVQKWLFRMRNQELIQFTSNNGTRYDLSGNLVFKEVEPVRYLCALCQVADPVNEHDQRFLAAVRVLWVPASLGLLPHQFARNFHSFCRSHGMLVKLRSVNEVRVPQHGRSTLTMAFEVKSYRTAGQPLRLIFNLSNASHFDSTNEEIENAGRDARSRSMGPIPQTQDVRTSLQLAGPGRIFLADYPYTLLRSKLASVQPSKFIAATIAGYIDKDAEDELLSLSDMWAGYTLVEVLDSITRLGTVRYSKWYPQVVSAGLTEKMVEVNGELRSHIGSEVILRISIPDRDQSVIVTYQTRAMDAAHSEEAVKLAVKESDEYKKLRWTEMINVKNGKSQRFWLPPQLVYPQLLQSVPFPRIGVKMSHGPANGHYHKLLAQVADGFPSASNNTITGFHDHFVRMATLLGHKVRLASLISANMSHVNSMLTGHLELYYELVKGDEQAFVEFVTSNPALADMQDTERLFKDPGHGRRGVWGARRNHVTMNIMGIKAGPLKADEFKDFLTESYRDIMDHAVLTMFEGGVPEDRVSKIIFGELPDSLPINAWHQHVMALAERLTLEAEPFHMEIENAQANRVVRIGYNITQTGLEDLQPRWLLLELVNKRKNFISWAPTKSNQ